MISSGSGTKGNTENGLDEATIRNVIRPVSLRRLRTSVVSFSFHCERASKQTRYFLVSIFHRGYFLRVRSIRNTFAIIGNLSDLQPAVRYLSANRVSSPRKNRYLSYNLCISTKFISPTVINDNVIVPKKRPLIKSITLGRGGGNAPSTRSEDQFVTLFTSSVYCTRNYGCKTYVCNTHAWLTSTGAAR